MMYTKKNGELSILAHNMNAFYELKYDSTEDKTLIEVYGDKASDNWSTDYEVAFISPVCRRSDCDRFDELVVLDKEHNIVAYCESADWIDAFIQGKDEKDYLAIYEKKFATIIRQLHTGVVDHVGQ